MITSPVLDLPRPLSITRAKCSGVEYRDYPGSTVTPITWENYVSSYLWDFSVAVNSFFKYIYIDMRYGNIIFKNPDATYAVSGETVVDVLDWGPFISAEVSFGELTFSPTDFKINIKGVEYTTAATKTGDVNVYDDVGVAEAGDLTFENVFYCQKDGFLYRRTSIDDKHTDWITAWNGEEGATPSVHADPEVEYHTEFFWWFTDGGVNPDTWDVIKSHSYLSFDTSSLLERTLVSATLRVYISQEGGVIEEEISDLVVYNKSWGTLDTSDFNYNYLFDTLVGRLLNADISGVGYYDIDIDVSAINLTGDTELMLAIDSDIDAYVPPDPEVEYNPGWGETTGEIGGHSVRCHSRQMQYPPRLTIIFN